MMSDPTEQSRSNSLIASAKQPLIVVPVGDNEVRYFTSDEEVDRFFGANIVERGLALAGAWGDLGMTEEEMEAALEQIRNESIPTPPVDTM